MRDTRRARLVLTLLVLTAFTLLTLDFRTSSGGVLEALRSGVGTVFGPLEGAVSSAVRPIANALSGIDFGGAHAQIQRLEQRIAALQAQVHTSAADRRRLAQLESLWHLTGAGQLRVVPARVVALGGADGFEWTVTIDVGSRDGITRLMPVVSGAGLVGRVVHVSPGYCTVLLAIDPRSDVGVRLADTGQVGYVTGDGPGALTLRLLDGHAVLHAGERLVTFGSLADRPYVAELPVGTVTRVVSTPGAPTRTAIVTPFVQFTALDDLAVIVAAPRSIPRNALLPPSPAPTASPRPAPTATTSPTSTAAPTSAPSPSPTTTTAPSPSPSG